jgi:hypothetical protein
VGTITNTHTDHKGNTDYATAIATTNLRGTGAGQG